MGAIPSDMQAGVQLHCAIAADRPMRKRKLAMKFGMVLIAAVALIAAVLLVLNFSAGEQHVRQKLPRLYGLADPQFQRAMGSLLGPPIAGGNAVQELLNGDQIFPPMLEAIRSAQRSITFETYIYWSGDIGRAFADALAERARAGVKVHVLLDWVGSARMDDALLDDMKTAGVQVRKFHKPHWYTLAKLNNRTHRKLLVVDGRVGFTGGVGIAPEWTGSAQDAKHWRDTHFRVEGPVVAQMQATFLDNWMKVEGETLHGDDYFPALVPVEGGVGAQMFSSSPAGGSENMELMYHMAITAADRSIDLAMAYFVPDQRSVELLVDALRRGVRLRIIVPGPITDAETVRATSKGMWGPLLEAGAQIYEFQPTMYHCKVLVIDSLMTSVGSTNFDPRSFRLNDEANLNVYDAAFAQRQTKVFEADLERSRRISLQEWRTRPLWQRMKERVGGILRSQL
jgi:cardiolipin synthase